MADTVQDRLSVGIVGCGSIFERYVAGLRRFPYLSIERCADVDLGLARRRAEEAAIEAWGSFEELLADRSVDVVVNLTPPMIHEDVTTRALAAGKHVYTEKPLAPTIASAERIAQVARASDRLLGSAPDTFLGSAGQTARRAIDRGEIGDIIGASAFVTHSRMEEWHPNPTAFFQPGGGPVLDLGPYYVTALVNCLGPIASVGGMSRIGKDVRRVSTPGRTVDRVDVHVPTHSVGMLQFESGALADVLMSFDVWPTKEWKRTLPYIEIYGTEGALSLADPNDFDGDVRIKRIDDADWNVLPVIGEIGGLRGLGVADLANALRGAPHHTHWTLAYHVLEALSVLQDAGSGGELRVLESRCERPAPLAPWNA